MFLDWFEVEFHSLVIDLWGEPISIVEDDGDDLEDPKIEIEHWKFLSKPTVFLILRGSHHRLKIGSHGASNAAYLREVPKLIRSHAFLAPAVAEILNRYIKADLIPVLETISHRLGRLVTLTLTPSNSGVFHASSPTLA